MLIQQYKYEIINVYVMETNRTGRLRTRRVGKTQKPFDKTAKVSICTCD